MILPNTLNRYWSTRLADSSPSHNDDDLPYDGHILHPDVTEYGNSRSEAEDRADKTRICRYLLK